MRVMLAVMVGMVIQAPLQFDVASIKPNSSGPGPTMIQLPPNGRVRILMRRSGCC